MKTKITKAHLKALNAKSEQLWLEFKEARKVHDRIYRKYQKASSAWLTARLEHMDAKDASKRKRRSVLGRSV